MKNTQNGGAFSLKEYLTEHIVTVIFVAFIIIGFILANDISFSWFLTELSNRFYRNAFLVLSLIIPVIAGLGLNFGLVVGAISGQLAIILIRYLGIGGVGGFWLCMVCAIPIAVLTGWLTGVLYNKTRGQEMIASLIVGFFGNGVYMFIVIFAIGAIIPVAAEHPMILPGGVGIRMTVDMDTITQSLENLLSVPFCWMLAAVSAVCAAYTAFSGFVSKQKKGETAEKIRKIILLIFCTGLAVFAVIEQLTGGSLTEVRDVPVVTCALIFLLGLFTKKIMKTKLGQDFRSCGQNQYIAESNGINVDRTRIIATILCTLFGAWGMIMYLQNIGTMNTYTAHNQIGLFSVAAILVGGATVSKATVSQALAGTLLFHSMFILSPEIGKAVFGQAILGEYFRTFMVYGVIGLALGLYVWKANKKDRLTLEP